MHRRGVGGEGHRPVRRAGVVDAGIGQGEPGGVGLKDGDAGAVPGVQGQAVAQLPVRQIDGHGERAPAEQPPGALPSAGADLENAPPADVPEQADVGLVQALGSPAEGGSPRRPAEKGPVLGLIGVGLLIPPASVRRGGLGGGDRAAGDRWRSSSSLLGALPGHPVGHVR
jgi:hypothetical protein